VLAEPPTAESISLHIACEVFHDDGYQIEEEIADPIAFAASASPDIMYLQQVIA
jgi:hypothetical protein